MITGQAEAHQQAISPTDQLAAEEQQTAQESEKQRGLDRIFH
jgi:hypothetical protein